MVVVPLTDATRGLVDAAFLAAMPDGAVLVNARRPVVDTDALSPSSPGRLRAALDVTDPEPLPAGHPLWSAPGLLLTPHVGGSVPVARDRAFRIAAEQIRQFARGEHAVESRRTGTDPGPAATVPRMTEQPTTSLLGVRQLRLRPRPPDTRPTRRPLTWNGGTDIGLLLLRFGVGGVIFAHGVQKVFGLWGGIGPRRGSSTNLTAFGYQQVNDAGRG